MIPSIIDRPSTISLFSPSQRPLNYYLLIPTSRAHTAHAPEIHSPHLHRRTRSRLSVGSLARVADFQSPSADPDPDVLSDFFHAISSYWAREQELHTKPIDFLRNQNFQSALGPFDGRVATIATLRGETYYITTNADYVPALPSLELPHALYLRSDMRYGTDDPIQWPQLWSQRFCHFPAIAAKDAPRPLHHLRRDSPEKNIPLFGELIQVVVTLLEHLQTLPTRYNKIVFAVTALQRTLLQLDALYAYMMIYKPRINDNLHAPPVNTPLANCVGAFTHNPAVAHQLWVARLPFWLLRPTHVFDAENILALVDLRAPDDITQDALDDEAAPAIIYSGNDTDSKIEALHTAARHNPWYFDPFASSVSPSPPPVPALSPLQSLSPLHSLSPLQPPAAPDPVTSPRNPANPRNAVHVQSGGWDKFRVVPDEHLPPSIDIWANALADVNQTVTPYTDDPASRRYVLPEPALFMNANAERRRKGLTHWTMLRDAFLYMLSQPGQAVLLSGQQWRDVLEGLLKARGMSNSRHGRRSTSLEDRIRPALQASGIDTVEGFPVPPERAIQFSIKETRDIVWQERLEAVKDCFAGRVLVEIPAAMGNRGWASESIQERHDYARRTATLMLDWTTRSHLPDIIRRISVSGLPWSPAEMEHLEVAVCHVYTQAFWEYFGRAAVVPLRLADC
ncbi:hypothetical protein B0H17DRAFT_1147100 [Mycena rosella]|uniref:Uncharacterized protein n=1 Tax=Mycena rosella TaxID=1033263 RepID=A0AAD7G2U9_MYCRO|nr:hypothetical protein B0H17DRAFT_1147100 [Mycena rosella]